MDDWELEREVRELVRGFTQLRPEDEALLRKWFAPNASTVEEVCRIMAISGPEIIRRAIRECGARLKEAPSEQGCE